MASEIDYFQQVGGVEAVKAFFGVDGDGAPGLVTSALRDAIREFQAQNGLAADGILGPLTTPKLRAVMAVDTVVPPSWVEQTAAEVVSTAAVTAAGLVSSPGVKTAVLIAALGMAGVATYLMWTSERPAPSRRFAYATAGGRGGSRRRASSRYY